MKMIFTAVMFLGLFISFIGCGRRERGPAYDREQEFRRQIAESVPVKEWGYAIADVRVSQDAQKVLVVFTLPGGTNGPSEAILEHDGFRRYKGTVVDADRRDAARREDAAAQEAHRSNIMAAAKSALPLPPPTNRPGVSERLQRWQVGSAPIIVILPDR